MIIITTISNHHQKEIITTRNILFLLNSHLHHKNLKWDTNPRPVDSTSLRYQLHHSTTASRSPGANIITTATATRSVTHHQT